MGAGLPPCTERCRGCAPERALDCVLFQEEHCGEQMLRVFTGRLPNGLGEEWKEKLEAHTRKVYGR